MKHLIIITLSLALSACGSGQKTTTNASCVLPPTSTGLWLSDLPNDLQVFGDSHAAGFSSCDPTAPNGVTTGFAVLLAEQLSKPLDDRAIGGTTTDNQLLQVQAYGTRHTAIKVAMLGFNDAYYRMPTAEFSSNVTQMLAIMSANADMVIIATPPHDYQGRADSIPDAVMDAYRDAILTLIPSLGLTNVRIVNITDLYQAADTKLAVDHLHFNLLGYSEITTLIANTIN